MNTHYPCIIDDNAQLSASESKVIIITDYFDRLFELQLNFDDIDEAKMIILGSRLRFKLNNVDIKQSRILNSGIGIFTTRNISKCEIITFYPGDYICYKKPKTEEIIKLGEITQKLGYKNTQYNNEYGLMMCNKYSICGEPSIRDNPTYLGHLINDGYKPSISDTENDYIIKSTSYANCEIIIINGGLHCAIIALRDIKKDEELYLSYGSKYWFSRL
jgi:UTP-glucose-1-phosphate uridylyltransferase